MDPDTCLEEIRQLVEARQQAIALAGVTSNHDRLVELVDGLDQWLTAGGFFPTAWQNSTS